MKTDTVKTDAMLNAPVSRRGFMARLGLTGLGLSLSALAAGTASAQASVVQDPALSALTAASVGYKPPLAGTVPTISLGPPASPSAIANAILYPAITDRTQGTVNPIFRYLMMAPAQSGPKSPDYDFVHSVNVSPLMAAGNMVVVEFTVDGSQFEIVEKGRGGVYRLTVDGVLVTPSAVPAAPSDNRIYKRLVDFGGVRAQRVIRVEYSGAPFGGVRVGPNDTLYYPGRPLGPRAIVLGDSFTAGFGGDARFTGYAPLLGALMGWDCWPSGVSGTGYLATYQPGTLRFRDRAQTDVLNYNPEVVIIAGGVNDQQASAANLSSEAAMLYAMLQQGLPNARIVVVGPWNMHAVVSPSLQSVHDTLAAQAASAGLQFVDPFGWVSGDTGNIANPQPTGSATYYTAADDLHPSQAGHEYLARKLAAELIKQDVL